MILLSTDLLQIFSSSSFLPNLQYQILCLRVKTFDFFVSDPVFIYLSQFIRWQVRNINQSKRLFLFRLSNFKIVH